MPLASQPSDDRSEGNRGFMTPTSAAEQQTPATSTLDLLARARLGDQTAWHELFARYEAPLRRFARGRLPKTARGVTDTDDMMQDATLNILRRLDRIELRFPGALLAYLRRSVRNRLIDERRRAARGTTPGPLRDDHPDTQGSPLDETLARDQMRRFREALELISPRDRRAIRMRLDDGASYDAIAAVLACPTANAARVTVARALRRLAKRMADGNEAA
jgi:RNA polymerase sigma-70 factor, ECF subfamily